MAAKELAAQLAATCLGALAPAKRKASGMAAGSGSKETQKKESADKSCFEAGEVEIAAVKSPRVKAYPGRDLSRRGLGLQHQFSWASGAEWRENCGKLPTRKRKGEGPDDGQPPGPPLPERGANACIGGDTPLG